MEKIYKAFKFRLLPTDDQKVLLSKHFGCSRFVYNYFLKEKQKHYLDNKKTINYNTCSKLLTNLKKQEEYIWLKEVNSQSIQTSLKNLELAYQSFFRKKSGFPNFKKRANNNSFHCPQRNKILSNNRIQIMKFKEGIKFIKHRDIKGELHSVTVSRTPTGKYYVSMLCEIPNPIAHQKTGKSVGVDLGLKDFLVLSDGNKYPNLRFLNNHQKELRKYQKHFSRKQKGSKRQEKARIKVARIHEKITNSRENMHHQVSSRLIKKYDLIALEDLNVKGMVKNHCLAQAISDVSWSGFVSKLKYKAQWYGKEIIVIDRFYPSSKTCSVCDHIKESLNLSERSWVCPECNTEHDRDINASKNILRRGLATKSSGIDDYRHGVGVNPIEIIKVSKGSGVEVSKKRNIRKYILKPIF